MCQDDGFIKNNGENTKFSEVSERDLRRNKFIELIAAAGEDDIFDVLSYINEKYIENSR